MGTDNLLELLSRDTHVFKPIKFSTWEKDQHCKIGVHGYSWINQIRKSCLRTSGVEAKIQLARKFMSKVNYLRRCEFCPYIVFDGAELEATNSAQQTKDLSDAGDIHETVSYLIHVLKLNKIEFLVAPYKANAQLAFLLLQQHVNVILTKEAEQILYGCENIIFEYNNGYFEYAYSRLKGSKFFGGSFTKQMVLQACMLGGCDALPNLQGVNLESAIGTMKKKAKKIVDEADYLKVLDSLTNVKQHMKKEYIKRFCKAMNTYRYQRVYDPTTKTIVSLEDFPEQTKDDEPYIGREVSLTSPNTAEDIANGSIHPITQCKMKDVTYIEGGYVCSKNDFLGKDELQMNDEMEKLFKKTSVAKEVQESVYEMAQAQYFTLCRQISNDLEFSKAFQKFEAECNHNVSSSTEGASSWDMNMYEDMKLKKRKEVEDYKVELEEFLGQLNALIDDASLQDAQYDAELYSRTRKEAEMQDDQAKRQNLMMTLETSCETTHKALSSVAQVQKTKTKEICDRMRQLESSHLKKLASILENIYNVLADRFDGPAQTDASIDGSTTLFA